MLRYRSIAVAVAAVCLAAAPAEARSLVRPKRPPVAARPPVFVIPDQQLIDFENLPTGESVFSQYSALGVTFPEQPLICEPLEGARSGAKALSKLHPGDEFDSGPLTIEFSAPQKSVRMFVGLDDPTGGRSIGATLRGYDAGGTVVATEARQLGPGPTSIATLMSVTAQSDCIVKVELHYQTSYFEVIDDLAFTTAGPPGAPDTRPPVVNITTPVNDVFLDYATAEAAFPLAGTVYEETRLKTLNIRVESEGRAREGLVNHSGAPPTYTFGSPNVHGLIFPGRNHITVTAQDYAGNTDSDSVQIVYEPLSGQAELLILTPTPFRGPLCWLRDFKTSTGISCHIITLEGIEADPRFAGARDIQERIKRTIAHAHRHHGTRYAMLVGDGDTFPIRYTRTGRRGVSWGVCRPASDLYYADLFKADGTFDSWDANNDGVCGDWWAAPQDGGTAADFNQINIDDCDLSPDIGVGRLPASTVEEVANYVNKVMSYESPGTPSWFSRLLLFDGPKEFPGDEAVLDWIADNTMPGFHFIKSYRPAGFLQWDHSRKVAHVHNWEIQIGDTLESGVGFAFCFDHGERDQCGVYGADRLDALHNAGRLPVVLASACNTAKFIHWNDFYQDVDGNIPRTPQGEFDRDNGWPDPRPEPAAIQPSFVDNESMAERFLVQGSHGAIAFIGAHSGTNVAGPDLCKLFPEAWSRGHRRLGDIWNDALTRFINTYLHSNHPYARDPFQAHHIHKFLLFGDPSLRLGGIPAAEQQAGEGAATPDHVRQQFAGLLARYRSPVAPLSYPDTTASDTVTITGRASARTTLAFYEGRRLLGRTQADGAGRFAIQLKDLSEGTHAISVRPAGARVRLTQAKTILIQVQQSNPTVADLHYPKKCRPDGLIVTGRTQHNETWVELIEGKQVIAGDYSQHGGHFNLRPTAPLRPGMHTLTLHLRNAAGRETTLQHALSVSVTSSAQVPALRARPSLRPRLH